MDMQCMPVEPSIKDEAARVYRDAVKLFAHRTPSIENIERYLRPGYALAARVMARMEREKLVSPPMPGGSRQWFGPGAKGRAAFQAFAESLRAQSSPESQWWAGLPAHRRAKVLPGFEGRAWTDVSDADRRRVRDAYFRALDRLRSYQAEFRHLSGWQYVGGEK